MILIFTLCKQLVNHRGFAPRAVMLGRSRGGLMALEWAVENADKVAGFAGIYPVCGVARNWWTSSSPRHGVIPDS